MNTSKVKVERHGSMKDYLSEFECPSTLIAISSSGTLLDSQT